MPGNENIEYTDEFITKLQVVFGKGFLSPGGMEEVAKILEGIDLSGKEVLDIGVGIGGPACLLVTHHGAGKVTGIDVEEPVLGEARATVSSQDLQGQIESNDKITVYKNTQVTECKGFIGDFKSKLARTIAVRTEARCPVTPKI